MPFEDLLEYLGVWSLLLLVLVPFWKGDDAISETARADITRWMLRINIPLPKRPWLEIVEAVFTRIFGQAHLSKRCLVASYAISISSSLLIFFVFVTWLDTILVPDLAQFGWPSGVPLVVLLYLALVINPIADFSNLLIYRRMLSSLESRYTPLKALACITTTAIVPFMVASLVLWLGLITVEVYFGEINPDFPGMYVVVGSLLSGSGTMLANGVAFTIFASTFVTVSWIWAAILGPVLFRLLVWSRSSYALVTYVLPIDERPIRSVGVFITAVVLLFLTLRLAFLNIFGN